MDELQAERPDCDHHLPAWACTNRACISLSVFVNFNHVCGNISMNADTNTRTHTHLGRQCRLRICSGCISQLAGLMRAVCLGICTTLCSKQALLQGSSLALCSLLGLGQLALHGTKATTTPMNVLV